jgi:uncharacterized membrane protein YhaH (DUF805 family)
MLVLMALTLVFALLGIATSFSTMTGGHRRTFWWSKIFAGLAFLMLGLLGFMSAPSLTGTQHYLTYVLAFGIATLGSILLRWGIGIRRRELNSSK